LYGLGDLPYGGGARGGFVMLAAITMVALAGLAAVARGMHGLPAAAGEGG
jgi:hypothetical protein